MAEKLRIHQLAKELNVDSKTILTKCRAEGVEVKNHMSTVLAGLAATIREWFSDSVSATATESSARVDLEKVRRKKPAPRKRCAIKKASEEPAEAQAPVIRTVVSVASASTAVQTASVSVAEPPPVVVLPIEAPVVEPPATEAPAVEDDPAGDSGDASEKVAATVEAPVEKPKPPPVIVPAGPRNVPEPVQLKGPRVIRVEAPETSLPPLGRSRPAGPRYRQTSLTPGAPAPSMVPPRTDAPRRSRGSAPASEPSGEPAKKRRQADRRAGRGSDAGQQIKEWRDRDLAERQERLRGATGRRAKRRAAESHGAIQHVAITQAEVTEPIVLKDFCAVTGISMAHLTPKFIDQLKTLPNINMTLQKEDAELLASEFGIELTVRAARSPLADIRSEFEARARPNLTTRAPVVTFLGHVDHGKTSLLDAIRQSNVTASEAGGITQHMGSYHIERDGLSVTFLDTPGHKAFTAMRARGAQLTDVVVLVIAADDGVMPQTVEAINHAKAAKVPIVVALNKIDVPGVDINKIYGQLAEHELAPTEWGGSIDVIKTSATQGTGIDDLIEHLSTLSELLELKADSTVDAYGRVVESQMKPGVGVVVRVLIQDGTLRKGDFVVCGSGFGKVRSLTSDAGARLASAGPSIPVEIAGLDELPGAGDELFQVESLKRAEHIAQEVKHQRRRDSLTKVRKPMTLDELFGQHEAGSIPELNIIIKADAQGSVDVLQKALSEFPSDQVRLKVLHAGVGGVAESDVLLAEASGAIVVGFHVVADSHVKRVADEYGVDIRSYRVIYHLLDDIKKALEGLLEPEEKHEKRGVAEVRNIFNISKSGTVAGCYVTEGVISRSHKVRVVRDSVVIREGANIQSIRRFKDDAKEVKSGHECGIKLQGFDDLKPGDILEAYEVVKIARKL